jgi:hypothetical protein
LPERRRQVFEAMLWVRGKNWSKFALTGSASGR